MHHEKGRIFLSEYIDLSRTQLWRYENGEDLRFTSLLKVLKALDISLAKFFGEGFDEVV